MTPIESAREVLRYRALLRNLVARDLKVRYRRSALGVLWTMLNPLLMMSVLTIVYATIFQSTVVHYPVYFLSAFIIWTFVSQTTSWATACLMGYSPLIRKIYVPKAIFIISTVMSGLVNLLISMVPLAAIMLWVGHPFYPTLLFVPVSVALATGFAFGLSCFLAGICIEFHDVIQIYGVLTIAWMYLTPIMYPLAIVPEQYRWLVEANPMYHMIEIFRVPIYDGQLPTLFHLGYATAWSLATLWIGWWFFERRAARIAYLV